MKVLKKLSVVLMGFGIFMILGKMGQSDLYNTSVLETLSGVLLGGAYLTFGKALNAFSHAIEDSRKKAKRIPFVHREKLTSGAEYERAV